MSVLFFSDVTQWQYAVSVLDALPNINSYWPLNSDYGPLDAKTANKVDGTFSTPRLAYGAGPFGGSESAFVSGGTWPYHCVKFESSRINFGATSWTFSTYLYATETIGPIYEYYKPIPWALHLWRNPNATNVFINPGDDVFVMKDIAFDFSNTWLFIAMVYDQPASTMKIFFNNTFIHSQIVGITPLTTNVSFIGYRYDLFSSTPQEAENLISSE